VINRLQYKLRHAQFGVCLLNLLKKNTMTKLAQQFRTLPVLQGALSLVSGYWSNATKSVMGASITFIGNDRPEHTQGFLEGAGYC
jgi:hypothetical protein